MARITAALLLLAAVLLVPTALAAETRETQHVYLGHVHDGKGYLTQFYPASEQTLYVLADVPNVLVPRRTEVYWWPITREYKADWDTLDELVQGTLEVDGRTLALEPFSLRYNGGYDSAKTGMLTGDAAAPAYAAYKQRLADYMDASRAYTAQRAAYDDQVEAWGKLIAERRAKGESTADLPAPPEPKAPIQDPTTITEPAQGFVVTLSAGTHSLRVRDPQGNVVAGSERTVVAFSHRREGLAYNVIAASKWTVPEVSVDPGDHIYVGGEQALYLQPSVEREYDAFAYAKLLKVQDTATQDRRGRWTWVPVAPYSGTTLQLTEGGATTELTRRPFYVRQRPGGALGYDILPNDGTAADPSTTFDAFEVRPQAGALEVEVPGVSGSRREIRPARPFMGSPLLALALAPLGGLGWVAVRRWRTR